MTDKETELGILPNEARQKLLSVVHFIRLGLEKHAEEGVVDFMYEPYSRYHEEYIETRSRSVLPLKLSTRQRKPVKRCGLS